MSEIERILNAREKKKNKSYLSNFLNKFKDLIKKIFKNYYEFKKFKKKEFTFSGWGLTTTDTQPPWLKFKNKENCIFKDINDELLKLVLGEKFNLTQFQYHDTNYKKIFNELLWRHYTVFNTVNFVLKSNRNDEINLVECGVCDGLTIHYALSLCKKNKLKFRGYLYDAWEELKSSDENLRFDYSYLDIEKTKKNLKNFEHNLIYNKGFIPSVFSTAQNPDKINWLHIDLNSTEATLSSLEFFYDKLVPNGIILFDDYGGFEKTGNSIDEFFSNKDGHFLNSPTGQGIFFKLKDSY